MNRSLQIFERIPVTFHLGSIYCPGKRSLAILNEVIVYFYLTLICIFVQL